MTLLNAQFNADLFVKQLTVFGKSISIIISTQTKIFSLNKKKSLFLLQPTQVSHNLFEN